MCSERILCRLGYQKKTGYKATRNPFDQVLDRARQSLQQLRGGIRVAKMESYRRQADRLTAAITEFLEQSSEVLKLIRSWLLHRTDGKLCAALDGLYSFAAVDHWQDVIGLIPNSLMDPSLRKSFINIMRKASRYRYTARLFYRTAKKFPIFQRMKAVPVHLPERVFQRLPASSPISSLEQTSKRSIPNGHHDINRICQKLHITVPAANAAFEAQARKTLVEGKFHAEVQLLYHLLTNPSPVPPRIICASKDACFLCHLLIHTYAKISTPRCHGKLYPGWRLPLTPEFRGLQISLNHRLEQRIRNSITSLLQNGARRIFPDPCESSCSTAVVSDTTAVPPSEIDVANIKAVDGHTATDVSLQNTPKLSSGSSSSSMVSMPVHEPVHQMHRQPSSHAEWTIRQSYALAQGEVVASSLPINEVSDIYTTEPLCVQLEYTKTERSILNEQAPRLRYRIQQLTQRGAQVLRESSYIPIIDITSIERTEERTYQLHELADLYLSAGDCILRLTLEPANHS